MSIDLIKNTGIQFVSIPLNISEDNLTLLSSKGIKNKDDLAELAVDELQDIIEINNEDASALIMKAREHWFN